MPTKTLIIFPYGGYESGSQRESVFWKVVELCQRFEDGQGIKPSPVVVLNRDTERSGKAKAFLKSPRSKGVDVVPVWSVDSCQMWLGGWGHIIDRCKGVTRIAQVPGDIDRVVDLGDFSSALENLIAASHFDLVIGDFESESKYDAKELIDTYGTYPLLANWFPEISRALKDKHIYKPRSEFLNVSVEVLGELLKFRKFAYEQTLNMLIRSWSFDRPGGGWKYRLGRQMLGRLQDDQTFRQYRDCLDQIERTERLLKLLWRDVHQPPAALPDYEDRFRRFSDEYDANDRRSTNIREGARRTIRTLLNA